MPTLRILVVGSGGREHALAWKLAQSTRVAEVIVAPGNGGTALEPRVRNAPFGAEDIESLLGLARANKVGLTVVGPEASLAAGLVDRFQAEGLRAFGPTQAAARLETSKAFAKEFMRSAGIPTAGFALFEDYDAAVAYVQSLDHAVVIKASGLAAGKGVIVCDTPTQAERALDDILRGGAFGEAGRQVVIEERLTGPEVSLLAFADGKDVSLMPPAQDHKRIYDGDQGPNTGGMGAYSPVPIFPREMIEEARRTVLQPAVDRMRALGTPYVGALYAGLMLTPHGMRTLEFNCRFGDPEAQVILPLLDSDLVDVIEACLDGRLAGRRVEWRSGAAATVVAAAPGYPGNYPKGLPIAGVREAEELPGVKVFHAGTAVRGDALVTNGGRVLAVTGTGADLSQALKRAYDGVGRIRFEGMHYRKDIGAGARGKV